jgi:hypothetical protein
MKVKILFIILVPIFISCSHSTTPSETIDFNLVFNYGVTGGNILNTLKNTYTKDLICAGDTTVSFTLSVNDKKQILGKMNGINFFAYPDTFIVHTGDTVSVVTPCSTYNFIVSYNSLNKRLYWVDEIMNPDTQATKLRELINLIETIIQSNPEYSKLPPASGGYQ